MQTCYNAIKCFLVNFMKNGCQLEKGRDVKLLLETVTYMAAMETATCIIKIETVICIMHCRKSHQHDYKLHVTAKNKKDPPT